MYVSPVLYFPEDLPTSLDFLKPINPLFGMLGIWSDALVRDRVPDITYWYSAITWSLAAFFGGCYLFMSREREFSVRV